MCTLLPPVVIICVHQEKFHVYFTPNACPFKYRYKHTHYKLSFLSLSHDMYSLVSQVRVFKFALGTVLCHENGTKSLAATINS